MVKYISRAGVYRIRNQNGDFYIGSSKDILNRFSQHRQRLRKGNHTGVHLQNAWNCYGEASFVFETVEECAADRQTLVDREQHYLDLWHPKYNCLKIAGSRLGMKNSAAHRAKISIANKGRKPTQESIEKTRRANMGRTPWNKGVASSSDTIEKQRASLRKTMSGRTNPFLGKRHTEETRKKIKEKRAHQIMRKGFHLSDETKAKLSVAKTGVRHSPETCAKRRLSIGVGPNNHSSARYEVIMPDGSMEVVHGLRNWCKERDLNYLSVFGSRRGFRVTKVGS